MERLRKARSVPPRNISFRSEDSTGDHFIISPRQKLREAAAITLSEEDSHGRREEDH